MRVIRKWAARAGAAAVWAGLPAAAALGAVVASVSPSGEVAEVRQVLVRFGEAVVPLGDLRQAAPFTLTCEGGLPSGAARWLNERSWAYDFFEPLAAGTRCSLRVAPGFQPFGGAIEGPSEYRFSTGAPIVTTVKPWPGSRVEEDQHFLLRLNGRVDLDSVRRAAWCEMEGLLERLPVKVVEGPKYEAVMRGQGARRQGLRREGADVHAVLLACQRPLAADARVRLVWGPGISSPARPGQPALVSRQAQRFEWQVRSRFTAEFTCERENAQAPCLPLRPLLLRFSAPVPREQALAVRLVPESGAALRPLVDPEERSDTLALVRFAAPLPENTRWRLSLPAQLTDDAGRPLANAAGFPLAVATGAMPPLAKFAAAPFGILESSSDPAQPALMPLTLRHVQADITGAATGGRVAIKRLGPETSDLDLLRWLARLRSDHDEQQTSRARSLLAQEAGVRRAELPQRLPSPAQPVLGRADAGKPAASAALPRSDTPPAPTEVLGLPLPLPGYHVIEVESRILGQSLLASRAPMYVRTGALVTNLAVHFKRGRSSSMVWVTTLDRGRPVAGARVAINNCHGQPLWTGSTDAQGLAQVPRGFAPTYDEKCLSREGHFVSARLGDDLAFVFGDWSRGIEPWRFNLPTSQETSPDRRAHTVFDRMLLRAGETVAMKHFVRVETEAGLALPAPAGLPTEVVLTHVGSGAEVRLPLAWKRGARASESRWPIPKNAALGLYDVTLQRGTRQLASGSFRVEAFRVPLVDARLSGPAGELVAPAEVAFAAQLQALAGGPMSAAPLTLSALLQPATLQFPGFDDFSFAPAGQAQRDENDAEAKPDEQRKLVADRVPATTNAQGAARFVVGQLPPITRTSELQAEMSFTDPNGEVQTVSQRLRLWPAAVVVGVRAPGWTARRGEVGVTAVVLSTDGRPLQGRELQIAGRVHQTFSTRKRIVGGFYAYDNQHQVKELGALCSGKSDKLGRMACSLKLDSEGEVELIARSRDDAGRLAEAASTVWVSGRGEWWFGQDNDDRIDVLPEKRSLEPGQTARLQVRMPFRQATALVTVEREGVIDARVVQLSGREPVIEVPIPLDAKRSWAPSVVVGVLVLRGRLRDAPWFSLFTWGWREPGEWWRAFRYEGKDWRAPTALVDLAKPAFKYGVAALEIGTAQHRLDVKVTPDKAVYGVRETVQAHVQVSFQGRPLAGAEIAFAAVDEGLLALRENTSWNLLGGLLQARPWGVHTATAQGEIIGRRHYGRKALPPGGGGGRNPTRELFDTLLLWRGTVQLDAQGRARIEVPLNDSLSSFRLVAIADAGVDVDADAGTGASASTGAGTGTGTSTRGAGQAGLQRFGTGSASVRVSQDLQMLAGLPPLAREGDRFDATFTLRNTSTRSMTVKATLAGQAQADAPAAVAAQTPQTAALHAKAPKSAALPAQSPQTVAVSAQVPQTAALPALAPQTVALPALAPQTVTLAAGAAAELRWPVQVPAGASRIEWLGAVEETGGVTPARDRIKTVQAVVPAVPLRVLQATLVQLEGQLTLPLAPPADALPGVGGVQATLQARLTGALPGLRRYFETYAYSCLEQKASRAIGLRDAGAWAALRDEAAGYLDSDGLAAYFPPQPGSAPRGSDRLSAYLLAAAHEAGWAWPEATRDAMLGGLTAFVEGRIVRRFQAPRPDLDVRKLAALEALARHGRVQPRWLDSLAWTPAAWPTSALLDAWSLYRRAEALPARAARLDEVQRLLRSRLVAGGTTLKFSTETEDHWWWLMEGPDANAARLLLAATESPAWAADMPVLLSGTLARQRGGAWLTSTANLWGVLALERFAAKFEGTAVGGSSSVQMGTVTRAQDWAAAPQGATLALPWAGSAALRAEHQGPGRPWLTVQALAALPLRAPLAAGYRVTRTLSAVVQQQPGGWRRGDTLRVRLEIEALADMAWVVLSDPVPTGATVLGGGGGRDSALATRNEQRSAGAWPAFEERGFDAWRAYYEWLPRGRHVIEYTLRLNASGRFGLPPTRVEAMYAPETFGETPNAVLEVAP